MARPRTSVPRSRVRWHRRAFLDPAALRYWLTVVAVAVVLTAVVQRSLAGADALRERWGPTADVLVTTADLRAGDPLRPAVSRQRWPASLAPADAVADSDPEGRAAADLDAGTPLTPALIEDGDTARAGERHLAIEAPDPGVEPGDSVDVWATADPTLDMTTEQATGPVVRAARVVRVGENQMVLAVQTDEVEALTRAVSLADLSVAVVP